MVIFMTQVKLFVEISFKTVVVWGCSLCILFQFEYIYVYTGIRMQNPPHTGTVFRGILMLTFALFLLFSRPFTFLNSLDIYHALLKVLVY